MKKQAVILFNYSHIESLDDVTLFYQDLFHGHIPEGYLEQGKAQFESFGFVDPHSAVSKRIANVLTEQLEEATNDQWKVAIGTKHSSPSVAEAVKDCLEWGAETVYTLPLSPLYSTTGTKYYENEVKRALESNDLVNCISLAPYGGEPRFIQILSNRMDELANWFNDISKEDSLLVFTAHSMPGNEKANRRFIEDYEQLARTLARDTGYPHFALTYRSGRPAPEKWLGPDTMEYLNTCLTTQKYEAYIFVELLSIIENIEVVQEIGKQAKESIQDANKKFVQMNYLNDSADFCDFLKDYILNHLKK